MPNSNICWQLRCNSSSPAVRIPNARPHMPPLKRRLPDSPAVIVIEDDFDARRIYSDFLRSKGWNVFTAADGRAGLNKTIELTPDAIVLDLAMPKVDGWTVLKQIRESSATAHLP